MLVEIEELEDQACIYCGCQTLNKYPAILAPHFGFRIFKTSSLYLNNKFDDISEGSSYHLTQTVECESCQGLFCAFRFGPKVMNRYYNGYASKEYFEERARIEPSFRKRYEGSSRNRKLPPHYGGKDKHLMEAQNIILKYTNRVPQSILDLGGGQGGK